MILILLSSIIILIDSKYKHLDYKKQFSSVITYPFYYIAVTPKEKFDQIVNYLSSQQSLLKQLDELNSENLILKANQLKLNSIQNENNRLRELLNSTEHLEDKLLVAEILDDDNHKWFTGNETEEVKKARQKAQEEFKKRYIE